MTGAPAERDVSRKWRMNTTLVLTDDDDGIDIVKSGAPHPSEELQGWLRRECHGDYRYYCDASFNVFFEFEDAEDARNFKARWNARARP
jgi:hypothetical protein